MSRRIPYADYLLSDHWKLTRQQALERAMHRCQCGMCPFRNYYSHELAEMFPRALTRLEVHHLTYERLGCEAPDDLLVLCGKCHATFHGLPSPVDDQSKSTSLGEIIAGLPQFRCQEDDA